MITDCRLHSVWSVHDSEFTAANPPRISPDEGFLTEFSLTTICLADNSKGKVKQSHDKVSANSGSFNTNQDMITAWDKSECSHSSRPNVSYCQ